MFFRKSLFIAFWLFLVSIAWLAMEKLLGFHDEFIQYHEYFTNFIIIPYILIYIRGIKGYRISEGGTISYLKALGFGLASTIFATAFSPFALWIFETILNPNFYQNMINYTVSHKLQSQAQALAYFNHENYRNLMIYGNIAQGVIFSAIIAFFSARKKG